MSRVPTKVYKELSGLKATRVDSRTKKHYDIFNIPIGVTSSFIESRNGIFRIFNYNFGVLDLSWSDSRFTGDHYAVFRYDRGSDSFIQISEWYQNYVLAERRIKAEALRNTSSEIYYRTDSSGVRRNTLNIPMLEKRLDSFAVSTPYGRIKVINENIGHAQDSWNGSEFKSKGDRLYHYIFNGVYYTKLLNNGFAPTMTGRRDILKHLKCWGDIISPHQNNSYSSADEEMILLFKECMQYKPMVIKRSFLSGYLQSSKTSTKRADIRTNTYYNQRNIPCSSSACSPYGSGGSTHIIVNQNIGSPEKCWKNEIFLGDNYAVFSLIKQRIVGFKFRCVLIHMRLH